MARATRLETCFSYSIMILWLRSHQLEPRPRPSEPGIFKTIVHLHTLFQVARTQQTPRRHKLHS
jgi:hypothetical protein